MSPTGIVPTAVRVGDKGYGHEARLASAYRTATTMREQQDRAVFDAEIGEWRRFVEDVPAAELQHEITVHLRLGKECLERPHLDGEHRLSRRHDEAHGVPNLGHLDANGESRCAGRHEPNRRRACSQLGDEWLRHDCTAGSVLRKRATCMSNR